MTYKTKFSFSLFFTLGLLLTQIGGVFAAPGLQNPTPVTGILQSITLESDTITGVTVINIDLVDSDQASQNVRVSLETAIAQGFVVLNGDGTPIINNAALGKYVEINSSYIMPTRQENQNPVGNALATFFSKVDGLDYETIMATHAQGIGFGVIAQALWLTTKLEGDVEIFEALIDARESGDFSAFVMEDGSTPANWSQLRKAILSKDKQNNVGVVISNTDTSENGSGNGQGNHGSGSENGNGNGNNNDNNKKDKDKNKDKDNKK